MRLCSRSVLLTTVVFATAVVSAPAGGQCRLCKNPSTVADTQRSSEDDLRLEIETSLRFDRLVVLGEGGGTMLLRPDGTSLTQGSVAIAGPRAMVGTARVHGQAGRTVRVELPRRIELFSGDGGRIEVDDVASDLPSLPRLDSAGNLTFRFGGRVRISGDAGGDYRGDLPITVDYQ